jgi:hypothetical protein
MIEISTAHAAHGQISRLVNQTMISAGIEDLADDERTDYAALAQHFETIRDVATAAAAACWTVFGEQAHADAAAYATGE